MAVMTVMMAMVLLTHCVTLGKSFILTESQFLHL